MNNSNARHRWTKYKRTPREGEVSRLIFQPRNLPFGWLTKTAAAIVKGMRKGGRA